MGRCLGAIVAAAVLGLAGCATEGEPERGTVTTPSTASPTAPAVIESPSPSPSTSPGAQDIAEAIAPCVGPDVSDEIERIQFAYYDEHTGNEDDFDVYSESQDYAQQAQRNHFDTSNAIRREHGEDVAAVYCRHWLDEQDWEKPESEALAEELLDGEPGPLYQEAEAEFGRPLR